MEALGCSVGAEDGAGCALVARGVFSGTGGAARSLRGAIGGMGESPSCVRDVV